MSQHPGQSAFERIKAGTASKQDYVSALLFLCDRIEVLERVVADRSRPFQPPTPQEVTAYARTLNFDLDGQNFCDYYEARNWCIGKQKMKSWKASVRLWKTRRNQEQGLQRPARLPDNLRPEQ